MRKLKLAIRVHEQRHGRDLRMRRLFNRLVAKKGRTVPCSKIPLDCNRKNPEACKGITSCRKNNKEYTVPRLYSKRQCMHMRKKGFTQRASCSVYS